MIYVVLYKELQKVNSNLIWGKLWTIDLSMCFTTRDSSFDWWGRKGGHKTFVKRELGNMLALYHAIGSYKGT